jgi:hypothetical protein
MMIAPPSDRLYQNRRTEVYVACLTADFFPTPIRVTALMGAPLPNRKRSVESAFPLNSLWQGGQHTDVTISATRNRRLLPRAQAPTWAMTSLSAPSSALSQSARVV